VILAIIRGYDYFQIEPPYVPGNMTRWRNRIGKLGGEKLLRETIAQESKLGW
jgi:hypothetical protein